MIEIFYPETWASFLPAFKWSDDRFIQYPRETLVEDVRLVTKVYVIWAFEDPPKCPDK